MVPLCAIIYREGTSDVSLPGNLPDNRSSKLEQGSLALNEGAQPGQPSCRARWLWLSFRRLIYGIIQGVEPLEGSGPTLCSKQDLMVKSASDREMLEIFPFPLYFS